MQAITLGAAWRSLILIAMAVALAEALRCAMYLTG